MAEKLRFYSSEADNLDSKAVETDSSVATPYNVKSDYLFKDAKTRELMIGKMPINPSVSIKLDPIFDGSSTTEYIIPAGYHDGSSRIYTEKLSDYTPGNANPEDVVSDKVFWVNGERRVGTLNVEMADQVATATENDLVEGVTAWVNKVKITGTIPKLPRRDKILLAGESYIVPYGLSPGTSVISSPPLEDQTQATAQEADIMFGQTAWVNGQKVTGSLKISDKILDIMADTDTAKNQVLSGKKFYSSVYNQVVSGTMPDHTGEATKTIPIGYQYSIPEGYYDGYSKITTQTLGDATQASATAEHIVANKTAWVNGVKITGSMPFIDPIETNIDSGITYKIPKGYHTGDGTIVVKSLDKQTIGTATEDTILFSKVAWVNGEKVVGTMPNNSDLDKGLVPGETFYIPEGYYSGTGSVWVKPLETFTPGDAVSGEIIKGKTAWVNGQKVTGTLGAVETEEIVLDAGVKYMIPAGVHDGTGSVEAETLENQTIANATSNDIVRAKTAWVNGQKITGTLELSGTAVPADVAAGSTFYNVDTNTKLIGTLSLSGTAKEEDVLEGVSFYNTNPKRKLTGSLKLTGTAKPENVLTGTSFYNTNAKTLVDGSMPNIGSVVVQLGVGKDYIIPMGYHDGTGVVKAPNFDVATEGTAEPADIYTGKTAWVNGVKITGSMTMNGTATPDKVLAGYTFYTDSPRRELTGTINPIQSQIINLRAGEEYIIPSGLHDGTGAVKTVNLSEQTVGTALKDDIMNAKTAWVNGVKVTGTMVNNGSISKTLLSGESYIIPKGYHSGEGIIIAESSGSQTVGDAVAEDLLLNKTAWVNGEKITGTMANNGSVSSILNAGESFSIPAGYHDGTGLIESKSLASQTISDATASNLLIDKTAWVNGEKITGTMANNGSVSSTLNAGESYTIPEGYHSGTGKINTATLASQTAADAIAEDIIINKTAWINGVKVTGTMVDNGSVSSTLNAGESFSIPAGYHDGTGSIEAKSLADQTIADAVADNLLIDKTAWVNGTKITGSMPDNGTISTTLSAGESYTIPSGYHSGSGVIETKSLSSQTQGDAKSEDILSAKTAWVNGVKVTGTITTSSLQSVRVNSGNEVTLPAGYYPDGITIYSLYTDRLDLTGTSAWYDEENQALNPEDSGYVDGSSLVVTAEILS